MAKFPSISVGEAEKRFEIANSRCRDASSPKELAKFNKEAWEAIRDVCHAYADPRNLQSNNPEQFPASIAMALWVLVGDAVNKNMNDSFDLLFAGQGSSRLPVLAIKDLERACMYVEAVKTTIVSDKTPIKTISVWYGVSARTVHGWIKAYDARELLQAFYPDASDIERGKLLISVTKKSGTRYSIAGRGQSAILLRAKKKNNARKSAE